MQLNLNNLNLTNYDTNIIYDVIILGGGPAGLNASIYAKRKGLKSLLITHKIGGQLENTKEIENYLGFSYIDSNSLIANFSNHINSLDISLMTNVYVTNIDKLNDTFYITLDNSLIYKSKSLIYALGSYSKRLGLENENKLNKISYCSVCDAPFYKDHNVVVVGGGNSALEAAIDLTHYAKHVTIVQRSTIKADQILVDKVRNNSKITILLNTVVTKINGTDSVESINVLNTKTNFTNTLNINGLFIEIGKIPNTKLLSNIISLERNLSVQVNAYQQTELEGLFVAGDSTNFTHNQIIIAASQGAIAALEASKYLLKKGE